MTQNVSKEIIESISVDLELQNHQVEQTLHLLINDCTIPFIARYRKEATQNLDEVQIRDIRDLYENICHLNERKETILSSIREQEKLTVELENKIINCKSKSLLEDIYLPFKPKKRTRAQIAIEKGLLPAAEKILSQTEEFPSLQTYMVTFVNSHPDLTQIENVAQGIQDIIAEQISEMPDVRGTIRLWIFNNAQIHSKVTEEFKDKKTKYNNYYEFKESIRNIAPHRFMAIRRGEKEDVLKFSIEYDEEIALSLIFSSVVQSKTSDEIKDFLNGCIKDSFSRLLSLSIETEIRLELKTISEEEAIHVFAKNLRSLLLLPPIPKRVVMGIDPGLRTGSKLVVVDKTGKLLDHATIFPHHDMDLEFHKNKNAKETLLKLIQKHGVSLISIGNGTAGREMESFIDKILQSNPELTIRTVMVNEAGASVYSASDIAREEFPDLDITYRGSVSIARRLQDPLAELVKIDPKSIGVGQYQHDVNQFRLKKQLGEVVESCVNYVGVNLNTASPSLLSYVAGIGPSLSKQIVHYRESHGEFKNRAELFNIPGLGQKYFEQCAGFLRISDGENPLDNTAVHPESYSLIERMSQALSLSAKDLIGHKENISKINAEEFVSENAGLPTILDILKELMKPGRDPREDGSKHSYNREVRNFDELKEGQIVIGTVSNVTNFGAFVDIGVHQDGLIHISEMSNKFIKDVSQAIHVGDNVKVKIIALDKERRRISLSKKACEEAPVQTGPSEFHHSSQAKDSRKEFQGKDRVGATGQNLEYRQSPRNHANNSQNNSNANSKNYSQRSNFVEKKPKNFLSTEKGLLEKNNSNEKDEPPSMKDLLNKFNSNRV